MRMRFKALLVLASPLAAAFVIAYMQWAAVGLPALPPGPTAIPEGAEEPYGFPAWLRHHPLRELPAPDPARPDGLQILMDHPRLYWNVDSRPPGTEWLRLTPIEVPKDRPWTAR